ncbi:MAG: alanine--tRNA ligase [Firmicutes bacterium]|nr:alanine--tRNA ligase [Bacillota bacterium]
MKNLKDLYLNFFESKGHKIIPSASVIPENDPTCLFNTAGMQPLIPYLLGEKHPLGTRLTDVQKCFRLTDLDEVGDKTHHTFFEMLGNWSLGDYFKKESIAWSFEFLTKELNIPIEKLAVTVFRGNDLVDADNESAEYWMEQGIPKERIAFLGEEDNWWGVATGGPCGSDTEIFYWRSEEEAPIVFDPEDKRWVEIWNNVFMQYNKTAEDKYESLEQKNVDTGMGVERTTAILENVDDNYKTSIWKDIIGKIEDISNKSYENENDARCMRIIADHIRAVVIITADDANIVPSNTDQGYILRRLIRRMIRYAKKLEIDINSDFDIELAKMIFKKYSKYYPEIDRNKDRIIEVLTLEKNKFSRTLEKGIKEFQKITEILKKQNINTINGKTVFRLYDTFGFPPEMTGEFAGEIGMDIDMEGFKKHFNEHQEKSRAGATEKFKGGLSDHSESNIKYHTATHLLHQALKDVLGNDVNQKGSNINSERLRFDFSYPSKLTDEQKQKVESIVNQKISEALDVTVEEMTVEEAKQKGAVGLFTNKYGDIVKVYSIGDYSKEICGGPHVKNTSELGIFKIKKEEAVGAGVRRIKAVLEI